MNTGIFGEGFPYSNFHDLNMDWIIKIAKDFLDQYSHIQEVITEGEESLTGLTETGLQELQDKYDNLETLLQQWYDTHSEDIANELADALQDIANELADALQDITDESTDALRDISNALANAVTSFAQQATTKAQETIATIPDDYTALSNTVQQNTKQLAFTTGNEILLSSKMAVGSMSLGGVNAIEGYVYYDVTRACSDLIPLHTGQVIRNNNILYQFGLYKYDRFGNYVTYDVWHDELYPITSDGLYRIVMRGVNNDNLSSVVDTINENLFIQDLSPDIYTQINGVADDGYFFNSSNLVQGRFYYCIEETGNENRIRPPHIIPVKVGTSVGIFPNGKEVYVAVYAYDDPDTAIETHTWSANVTNITIAHEGYMAINIRNSDDSNLAPSDFTGYISVTNRNKRTIICDASGNGDTANFAKAVMMAFVTPNTTIYVRPGLYDIVQNLEALFGQGFLESMQATYFLVQGLPWGNGMKIIGSRGATIKFDASSIVNTVVHHDFSILNSKIVDNGYTLENEINGLFFWAINCKYCVHMDQGAINNDNMFTIKNCTMLMDNSGNTEIHASNCIGMGASINTTYIIENNYLNSVFAQDARDYETIYYHNTNAQAPDNKIIIKDNYINGLGTIRVDPYGSSQNRCIAQITGNSVGSAMLLNGDGTNIKYLEWNNVVR